MFFVVVVPDVDRSGLRVTAESMSDRRPDVTDRSERNRRSEGQDINRLILRSLKDTTRQLGRGFDSLSGHL